MAQIPMEQIDGSTDISSAFTFNTSYVSDYSARLLNGVVYLNIRIKTGVASLTNLGSFQSQYAPFALTRGVVFDSSNGKANGFIITNDTYKVNFYGNTTAGENFGQVVYPII